jgi:hypothetical protein
LISSRENNNQAQYMGQKSSSIQQFFSSSAHDADMTKEKVDAVGGFKLYFDPPEFVTKTKLQLFYNGVAKKGQFEFGVVVPFIQIQ